MLKRVLAGFVIAIALLSVATAGPWEDGVSAYTRGDYATALWLWKPLADQGDARAQNNIGVLYEKGLGVAQSDAEAAKWYTLAAEQGHTAAEKNLQDLRDAGRAPNDLALTGDLRWVAIASRQSVDEAIAIASLYLKHKPRVVKARNGWYAVVLGPHPVTTVDEFRGVYKGPVLPSDTMVTRGTGYLETVWIPFPALELGPPASKPSVEPPSSSDDWADCAQRMNSDLSILSCTKVIGAGENSSERIAYAYYNRGNAHADKGDYERAIADYDQAIRLTPLKPDFAEVYYNRGLAYEAKGNLAKALIDFRIAARLLPAGSPWHTTALQRISEIERRLAAAPSKPSAETQSSAASWAGCAQVADSDLSIRACTSIIASGRESGESLAVAFNSRGIAHGDKGNHNSAIADFTSAIQIKPDYAFAYFNRGVAYVSKSDLERALNDFRTAARLFPASDPWRTKALIQITTIESKLARPPLPLDKPSPKPLVAPVPSPVPDEPGHRIFSVGDGAVVEVSSFEANGEEVILITLDGELKPGDNKSFARAAIDAEFAVVALSSPGGDLQAGIEIGEAIRLKEFATLVPRDFSCASACALAWLAGQPRYMEPGARIGFHAPSRADDPYNRSDSAGSAIVGAYLNKLGLPSRAIAYFTEKQPEDMQWLTFEDADRLGIYVKEFGGRGPDVQPVGLPETETPSINRYRVLLGTFPSQAVANETVKQVIRASLPSLGRASPLIEVLNDTDSTPKYQVAFSGLDNLESARLACANLHALGLNCVVLIESD